MRDHIEPVSPSLERVTVAEGRSLVVSAKWIGLDGADCESALILGAGKSVEVAAPTARVLRAEGIIAP